MTNITIKDFIRAINSHNHIKIANLVSKDFILTDVHGNHIKNTLEIKSGWETYFAWFPDYKIETSNIIEDGNTFAIFVFDSGTNKGIKTENNST